jgi:hypothetical protein
VLLQMLLVTLLLLTLLLLLPQVVTDLRGGRRRVMPMHLDAQQQQQQQNHHQQQLAAPTQQQQQQYAVMMPGPLPPALQAAPGAPTAQHNGQAATVTHAAARSWSPDMPCTAGHHDSRSSPSVCHATAAAAAAAVDGQDGSGFGSSSSHIIDGAGPPLLRFRSDLAFMTADEMEDRQRAQRQLQQELDAQVEDKRRRKVRFGLGFRGECSHGPQPTGYAGCLITEGAKIGCVAGTG